MTVLSLIASVTAVTLFGLPAAGGKISIDLHSNGRYWWGGPWSHEPKNGQTDSCVCFKGRRMTGVVDAVCVKGLKIKKTGNWFIGTVEDPRINIPFNGNYPIDITTMGHDAVWMDRLKFETNAGSRWFGSDNTHGWCLSRDKHDGFDKYATHEGCFPTLSFYPNGKVYAGGERGLKYASDDIVRKTQKMCADLGRRRVEDDAGMMVPAGLSTYEEAPDFDVLVDVENLDDDPAGEFPKQVHNALDGLIVTTLHKAIRDMVRNNDDVTYAQIDQLLNSAMLEAEHLEEQIEHEGEVLAGSEPEAMEGFNEPETLEGSIENRNVEGRLQNLEESP